MKKLFSILMCGILVLTFAGCGSKETKETKANEKEYYCEEGTLKGENCEVVATEEAIIECEEGFKVTDGKCVKTTTTNAKANKSCATGYELKGDMCLSTTDTKQPGFDYECMESYTQHQESNGYYYQAVGVKDGACIIRICRQGPNEDCYETPAEAKSIAKCEDGYTLGNDFKCHKSVKVITTYSCTKGELEGSKCVETETGTATKKCSSEEYTYNEKSDSCEKVTITKALLK